MLRDLTRIRAIMTSAERRRSVVMLVLVILMAFAETAGVISIMPFLSVLARPEVVHENRWLQGAYNGLGLASTREFITVLGLASIVMMVGASVFKTITLHLVNRFISFLRHSISARLLSGYLHQPYEFFLQHNPSVLSRNVLSEVDELQDSFIKPLSQLIAQGAVALAMMLLLFAYSPLIALCVVAVVGLLYGVIYRLVPIAAPVAWRLGRMMIEFVRTIAELLIAAAVAGHRLWASPPAPGISRTLALTWPPLSPLFNDGMIAAHAMTPASTFALHAHQLFLYQGRIYGHQSQRYQTLRCVTVF